MTQPPNLVGRDSVEPILRLKLSAPALKKPKAGS